MKKNKQPHPKPKCTISSRRLLETVPIQELRHPAVVCVPSPQINKACPSECDSCACNVNVSASGACCSEPQCEENSTPIPEKELTTPTILAPSQAKEVEAMIEEIRNCREIIRSLALEAMDILHPENSQQYKQVPAEQPQTANGMASCQSARSEQTTSEANFIAPASQAKPIDLKKITDCSEKKCVMAVPIKDSGSEEQSTTRLKILPPSLSKPAALLKKPSDPIAQAAHQLTEKSSGQNLVKRKPSNCSCDGEKRNADCKCNDTMNQKALDLKPSACSCDRNQKKKVNCKCEGTLNKRNKELEKTANKTNSRSFLQKTFGWVNCDTAAAPAPGPVVKDDCVCDDVETEKQNKANSLKEKRKGATASSVAATACPMPKCAANTCICHFPPAYSQYFDCTGHVSGNCNCNKNA